MSPTILELFLLSLIDRGLRTKYDLQRKGGVSLGSSSPALIRMQAAKLVVQDVESKQGKRPRHGLKLSAAGRKLAREGWKTQFRNFEGGDIDAILRVVDMAFHNGANATEIADFLELAASARRMRDPRLPPADPTQVLSILATQARWESAQSQAEAKFLLKLAELARIGSALNTKSSATKQSRKHA